MSTNAIAPGTGDVAAAGATGTPLANLATLVLIAATVLTGLATGVIALYAHTIMPGLKKTDDRTFVGAFQNIDRAILNPWFMTTFFGALILLGIAAYQHRQHDQRTTFGWLLAAFGLYLIVVIITMTVHVPANDRIDAAGNPAHIDVAKVRATFNESRWMAWNYVRVVLSLSAFTILTGVLATVKHR